MLHILHRMLSRPQSSRSAATNLRDFLQTAFRVMQRRSLIFIVSDFISTPGWDEPLAHLAQRHEIVAVRLYDPLEMDLPDLGLLMMRDAETGEQLFVDTHDRAFPEALRSCGGATRKGAPVGITARLAWTRWSCLQTTILSMQFCGSPICASGEASWRRAEVCRST